jgi:hypothetical protein
VPKGSLRWHYNAGVLGVFKGVYAHVTANKGGLTVRHISSGGELVYTAPTSAPRTGRSRAHA